VCCFNHHINICIPIIQFKGHLTHFVGNNIHKNKIIPYLKILLLILN